jgi:hypothetical protein
MMTLVELINHIGVFFCWALKGFKTDLEEELKKKERNILAFIIVFVIVMVFVAVF